MFPPTQTEQRYAICIGINRYPSSTTLSPLKYAEHDAKAMDQQLGTLGFAPENRVLLLNEEATLQTANEALSDIILDRATENDLVVFYYAGHSVPLRLDDPPYDTTTPQNEVFLATYDFDRQKIKQSRAFRKQQALGMERLRRDFFEGEGSRKRLFLFDCCYSGDFYGPRYRDTVDPVQSYIQHIFETKSIGRLMLSSCLPIQKAVENPALEHGHFTYYVLKALAGKAPEAVRPDGYVTVNSLFEYLANKLPNDQRPVLGGVQQDVFVLVHYPELVRQKAPHQPPKEHMIHHKELRLRALLADHSGFLRDRLDSFVGREAELAEIQYRITEKMQTGGYVTITGQAGQGKSSIIAKLVEMYGLANCAFHFIPINPGPDHQVGLLRNLMARLILKYDMPDIYVTSESRPALRDYFPKVLTELVAKGGQEIIFIDGLDQLEEEFTGVRDLSFLPNNPPSGVVFVLGTRPNDTLRPLELLKPRHEYRLPDLSRRDFDLLLQHRDVHLDRGLADRFYRTMEGNALYLDLIAKEVREQKHFV